MKAGDVINGYTILEDFRVVGAGLSKWTFAARDGRAYFIKEFLSPTYPDEHAPGSAQTKMRKRQRCQAFERHHRRIQEALATVSCLALGVPRRSDGGPASLWSLAPPSSPSALHLPGCLCIPLIWIDGPPGPQQRRCPTGCCTALNGAGHHSDRMNPATKPDPKA